MKLTELLSKACEDGDGNVSTMRVVVLYGCAVNLTIPAALWIAAAFGSDKAAALCVSASTACGSVITALLAIKLVQNATENAANQPPAKPNS